MTPSYLGGTIPGVEMLGVLGCSNESVPWMHSLTGSPSEAAEALYTGKDDWHHGVVPFTLTEGLAVHSGLLNHPLLPKIKPRALCLLPLSCVLCCFLSQGPTLEPRQAWSLSSLGSWLHRLVPQANASHVL